MEREKKKGNEGPKMTLECVTNELVPWISSRRKNKGPKDVPKDRGKGVREKKERRV